MYLKTNSAEDRIARKSGKHGGKFMSAGVFPPPPPPGACTCGEAESLQIRERGLKQKSKLPYLGDESAGEVVPVNVHEVAKRRGHRFTAEGGWVCGGLRLRWCVVVCGGVW